MGLTNSQIYKLFYDRWNPKLMADPEYRKIFLTELLAWKGQLPHAEESDLAIKYATIWSRSSNVKSRDELTELFEEAIKETK